MKLIKTCNTCGKTLNEPVLVEINCVVQCGKCLVRKLDQKKQMYYLDEFVENWK